MDVYTWIRQFCLGQNVWFIHKENNTVSRATVGLIAGKLNLPDTVRIIALNDNFEKLIYFGSDNAKYLFTNAFDAKVALANYLKDELELLDTLHSNASKKLEGLDALFDSEDLK